MTTDHLVMFSFSLVKNIFCRPFSLTRIDLLPPVKTLLALRWFFYAVCLRKRYGPQGWFSRSTVPYSRPWRIQHKPSILCELCHILYHSLDYDALILNIDIFWRNVWNKTSKHQCFPLSVLRVNYHVIWNEQLENNKSEWGTLNCCFGSDLNDNSSKDK